MACGILNGIRLHGGFLSAPSFLLFVICYPRFTDHDSRFLWGEPLRALYSFLEPVSGVDDMERAAAVGKDHARDARIEDHSFAHHAGA